MARPDSFVCRRSFLQASAAVCSGWAALSGTHSTQAAAASEVSLKGRIFKSLKVGMVRVEGSLTDKFNAARAAGFDGIELNAPGVNVAEAIAARDASGLPIDGTVNSTHWNVRHSDPSESVRAEALESLKSAIRLTHAVGGHTALLVIGHGKDGPEEVIWPRAMANIAQAVPLAARLGVVIAIENVWNHFLYDHEGDSNQSADRFVRFVDELNSPWVGMQFDIGNHWKYGSMGDWIRQLGRRVVKLDVKGFSRAEDRFTKIGEGDVDWADVRQALIDIDYYGWAAAEVGGGGPDRLAEISRNMDRVFGLG